MLCITLPVDDLQRTLNFYEAVFELVPEMTSAITPTAEHLAFELPSGLYLVTVLRGSFRDFTRLADTADAPARTCECMLTYFATSRAEVDQIIGRARQAGGSVANPPQQQVWGYAGYLVDPDGHLWEILCTLYEAPAPE